MPLLWFDGARADAISVRGAHPGVRWADKAEREGGAHNLVPLQGLTLGGDEAAGVLAALGTTVADLHEVGIGGLALDPRNIWVTQAGRPLLVQDADQAAFLPGKSGHWAVSPQAQSDVAALGCLLAGLIPLNGSSHAERGRGTVTANMARLASRPRRAGHRPLTARTFVKTLLDRVPTACLPCAGRAPVTAEMARSGPSIALRSPAARLGVATLLGLGAFALAFARIGLRQASDSTNPLRLVDGTITLHGVRYALGQPGDLAVTGSWSCGTDETVVVIRPTDGTVWWIPQLPSGQTAVSGRFVGHVAGAFRATRQDDGRCDRLVLERRSGPTVVLGPWPGP